MNDDGLSSDELGNCANTMTADNLLKLPESDTNEISEQDICKENSCGINHASVIDRYYTPWYNCNLPKGGTLQDLSQPGLSNCNDIKILRHSNRICLVTLAPSHPVITNNSSILSINFKISEKLDRSHNSVSGKRKRGAQWLNANSLLCTITCEDESQHHVYAGIRGSLIEINDALLTDPSLLQTAYESERYIAIIMPKLKEADHMERSHLSHAQYIEYMTFVDSK